MPFVTIPFPRIIKNFCSPKLPINFRMCYCTAVEYRTYPEGTAPFAFSPGRLRVGDNGWTECSLSGKPPLYLILLASAVAWPTASAATAASALAGSVWCPFFALLHDSLLACHPAITESLVHRHNVLTVTFATFLSGSYPVNDCTS